MLRVGVVPALAVCSSCKREDDSNEDNEACHITCFQIYNLISIEQSHDAGSAIHELPVSA